MDSVNKGDLQDKLIVESQGEIEVPQLSRGSSSGSRLETTEAYNTPLSSNQGGKQSENSGKETSIDYLMNESISASYSAAGGSHGTDGEAQWYTGAKGNSLDNGKYTENERGETGNFTQTDWTRNGDEVNKEQLQRAVSSAGMWAYGVVAAEVWVFNQEDNLLHRPPGGYWRDPVFEGSRALLQLEDETRPDYVKTEPLGPGVGLPGVLWSETRQPMKEMAYVMNKMNLPMMGRNNTKVTNASVNDVESNLGGSELGPDLNQDFRKVAWRNVNALAADPDQPPNERLQVLGKAGFGLAAGVLFNIRGSRGIVVYMARATVDRQRLQSGTNEAFMRSAADVIGAETSVCAVRKASIEARALERSNIKHRIREKMLTYARIQIRLKKNQGETGKPEESFMLPVYNASKWEDQKIAEPNLSLREKVGVWIKKSNGLDVSPPPAMPLTQAVFTLFGAFVSLSIMLNLFFLVSRVSDGALTAPFALFGALVTLQYGLTAAPAAQPRNMIYGQVVSVLTAFAVRFVLNENVVPRWFQCSFATALAASLMVLLGVVHPPGGAAAMLFSLGNNGWNHLGLLILADVVAISVAVAVNNLSRKRQYPTYWAFW